MLYYIIFIILYKLCYIVKHRIASYYITKYHITSHLITSHYILSIFVLHLHLYYLINVTTYYSAHAGFFICVLTTILVDLKGVEDVAKTQALLALFVGSGVLVSTPFAGKKESDDQLIKL